MASVPSNGASTSCYKEQDIELRFPYLRHVGHNTSINRAKVFSMKPNSAIIHKDVQNLQHREKNTHYVKISFMLQDPEAIS
jgi:hypothetical protein